MSRVVSIIFEPAHVFCGTCCIFSYEGSGKSVQARISHCYSLTQRMDKGEDSEQHLNLLSRCIRHNGC